MKHIGAGKVDRCARTAEQVVFNTLFEVFDPDHFGTSQFSWGRAAQSVHHCSYGRSPIFSFFGNTLQRFFIEPETQMDGFQLTKEAAAFGFCPSSCLGNECGRSNGVLVAYKITHQVSVALFSTADEGLFAFLLADQVSDPFEARQADLAIDSIGLCHFLKQVGGDDGFSDELLSVEFSLCLPGFQQIIDQYRRRLIAIKKRQVARVVSYSDAHAVGVGVASDHQVGSGLLCLLYGHIERLGFLWIWTFHRGEGPVGHRLLLNRLHIFESQRLEGLWHKSDGGSMDRSEDDLQVLLATVSQRYAL